MRFKMTSATQTQAIVATWKYAGLRFPRLGLSRQQGCLSPRRRCQPLRFRHWQSDTAAVEIVEMTAGSEDKVCHGGVGRRRSSLLPSSVRVAVDILPSAAKGGLDRGALPLLRGRRLSEHDDDEADAATSDDDEAGSRAVPVA